MGALEKNFLQLKRCMRGISLQVLCEINNLDKSLSRNANVRGQLILMEKKKTENKKQTRHLLCQAIVPTSKTKKNIKKYPMNTLKFFAVAKFIISF